MQHFFVGMTHQRHPTRHGRYHLHELPPALHVPTGSCNTVVIHCMLHMAMVDSSADGSPARTQVGVGVERARPEPDARRCIPAVPRGVDPGPPARCTTLDKVKQSMLTLKHFAQTPPRITLERFAQDPSNFRQPWDQDLSPSFMHTKTPRTPNTNAHENRIAT